MCKKNYKSKDNRKGPCLHEMLMTGEDFILREFTYQIAHSLIWVKSEDFLGKESVIVVAWLRAKPFLPALPFSPAAHYF